MKSIFVLVVSITVYSITGSTLWGWFIVPAFKVDPISYAMALGIILSCKFFTGAYDIKEEYKDGAEVQVWGAFMLLGIGWLTNFLMLTYNL